MEVMKSRTHFYRVSTWRFWPIFINSNCSSCFKVWYLSNNYLSLPIYYDSTGIEFPTQRQKTTRKVKRLVKGNTIRNIYQPKNTTGPQKCRDYLSMEFKLSVLNTVCSDCLQVLLIIFKRWQSLVLFYTFWQVK